MQRKKRCTRSWILRRCGTTSSRPAQDTYLGSNFSHCRCEHFAGVAPGRVPRPATTPHVLWRKYLVMSWAHTRRLELGHTLPQRTPESAGSTTREALSGRRKNLSSPPGRPQPPPSCNHVATPSRARNPRRHVPLMPPAPPPPSPPLQRPPHHRARPSRRGPRGPSRRPAPPRP